MELGSLARWIRKDGQAWEGALSWIKSEGSGRDVMLVHGLAASHECWRGVTSKLVRNDKKPFRVHTVQMRGFAGQPPPLSRQPGRYLQTVADELADYIRASRSGPVALCGHSMGGIVSLIVARDHPEVVDRLMVVDVPSFFSVLINPFATEATFAAFAEATRRAYLDRSREALLDDLRRSARRMVTDEGLVEQIVSWGGESDQALTADVMAEVMTTDLRPDLPRIPVLADIVYAWDRQAPTTRVGLDQLYASAYSGLAGSRLIRIDDARHYVMLDQSSAFLKAVRSWLAR